MFHVADSHTPGNNTPEQPGFEPKHALYMHRFQVDVEVERPQIGELAPEQILVPTGIQRQFVVCQHIGALLGVRPARRDHDRYIRHT